MSPFIRSITELKAITESRDIKNNILEKYKNQISIIDSGQRKRYLRSIERKEVKLPFIPKTLRRKWIRNKESVSRFFDELNYTNNIQSSYDLTLQERQNNRHQRDTA